MPRQRFIWPTLWDDPDIGRLDPLAQLLYIGCFSLADDDGRIHGEPEFLKAAVFRYRKISVTRVRQLRDSVAAACSHFKVYEVDDISYIAFTNWPDFQKPKYPKPSKLPPPPGWRKRRKPAPEQEKPSGNDSSSVDGTFREASPIGKGREGFGLGKALNPGGSKPRGEAEDTQPLEGLPLNKAYEVMQILKRTHGADEGSPQILDALARRLPQSTLADVRSRCAGKHIGWAVKALKGELEESVA